MNRRKSALGLITVVLLIVAVMIPQAILADAPPTPPEGRPPDEHGPRDPPYPLITPTFGASEAPTPTPFGSPPYRGRPPDAGMGKYSPSDTPIGVTSRGRSVQFSARPSAPPPTLPSFLPPLGPGGVPRVLSGGGIEVDQTSSGGPPTESSDDGVVIEQVKSRILVDWSYYVWTPWLSGCNVQGLAATWGTFLGYNWNETQHLYVKCDLYYKDPDSVYWVWDRVAKTLIHYGEGEAFVLADPRMDNAEFGTYYSYSIHQIWDDYGWCYSRADGEKADAVSWTAEIDLERAWSIGAYLGLWKPQRSGPYVWTKAGTYLYCTACCTPSLDAVTTIWLYRYVGGWFGVVMSHTVQRQIPPTQWVSAEVSYGYTGSGYYYSVGRHQVENLYVDTHSGWVWID